MDTNTFFVIWRETCDGRLYKPEFDGFPTTKFPTYREAMVKAADLTREHPKNRYFILQAISVAHVAPHPVIVDSLVNPVVVVREEG